LLYFTQLHRSYHNQRCKCNQQEEAIHAQLKCTGAAAGLSEPSRRYSTFRQPLNATSQPSNTTGQSNGVGSTPFAHLPKLTESEIVLLNQHDGCCKCRRFYVGHKYDRCPNGFPSGENYKHLTAAEADAAKKCANNKTVAAVVTSDAQPAASAVAAVLGSTSYETVREINCVRPKYGVHAKCTHCYLV
jgi:hypothetical protein